MKKKNLVFVVGNNFFSSKILNNLKKSILNDKFNIFICYTQNKHQLKETFINMFLLNPINYFEIILYYLRFHKRKGNIRFFYDINEKKFINYINSKKPFLIVSLMNSQIYKKKTLDNINSKIVNFHTGILPKYRGIYPNFYSILHHEKKVGLTFHQINEKIDDGLIINQIFYNLDLNEKNLFELSKKIYLSYKTKKFIIKSILDYKKLFKKKSKELKKNKLVSNYYSYPKILELIKFKFS